MDFKLFAKAKDGYNAKFVIIDRLSKQSVLIPCYKTTIAKEIAQLFITYIYRFREALQFIISDKGP